ncbi:Hypothetical protein SRAE_X000234400 [Strongyloides ratti]|uniref:Uncharacterized protein n=1 Tax=Strongyloides ratti TaxID=34506 RepID=A0A090KZF7_STRRB|nr:Hypothetical protein SRAE_X000234400 [Strongyloides ratti]CEF60609.1 Hypothetical protein SRAE_X000234400 [Strongyloides ratti]
MNIHTDDFVMVNLLRDINQNTRTFNANITAAAVNEMSESRKIIDKIKKLNVYFIKNTNDSQLMYYANQEASKLLHGDSISSMKTNEETSLLDSITDGGI